MSDKSTKLSESRKGGEAPVTHDNQPASHSDTAQNRPATGGQSKQNIDPKRMHEEMNREAHEKLVHDDVHHFEGQDPAEAARAEQIRKSPSLSDEAKLNALDDAEALPHHGFLPGDL